jgi:hypothetical protein
MHACDLGRWGWAATSFGISLKIFSTTSITFASPLATARSRAVFPVLVQIPHPSLMAHSLPTSAFLTSLRGPQDARFYKKRNLGILLLLPSDDFSSHPIGTSPCESKRMPSSRELEIAHLLLVLTKVSACHHQGSWKLRTSC